MRYQYNKSILALLLVLYSVAEVFQLLLGFGVISLNHQAIRWASVGMLSSMQFGGLIEAMLYSQFITDDRRLYIPFVRGMILYSVPVAMTFAGQAPSWLLVLSLVLYVALMVRVVWSLVRIPSRAA